MQRIPPLRPIMRRSYLNLDSIFGHIFSNLPGEPLTPNRIATFYLLRILFETHFGKKHVKSKYPFTYAEKSQVFQTLFSLMTLDEEVDYKTYRLIVRMAFGENRSIARHFYMSMEQLGRGYVDLNLYVEDEFYTNRHLSDPNPNLSFYDRLMINERKIIPFSSCHSFMYRWMKSLMAQHTKTTPHDMFEVNKLMRHWIMQETFVLEPSLTNNVLPYCIESSMRARQWCAQSIYYIQKCPRYTAPYDDLLNYAQLVQKRHKDVYEAYLVESLIHIQMKDCPNAIKAMKTFFDYTMLDLNENMGHCARTHRLAVPNSVPLLYAPLLQARICRTFGDYEQARQLLQESIQQAQLHSEEIGHELANLELHIIEIIGCEPLLEDRIIDTPNNVERDRRVQRKALRGIEDMICIPLQSQPVNTQTEDEYEFCGELDSLSKMMMVLRKCAKGTYTLRTGQLAETGMLCSTVSDYNERGMRIELYGHCIMTSNLIRNGMYDQARSIGSAMTIHNFSSEYNEEHFEEEMAAVIACNLAYSHAGQGEYDKALEVLYKCEYSFPEELLWRATRQTVICKAVIDFERFLLYNRYKQAEAALCELIVHSQLEYKLRKALLMAIRGKKVEAVQLLTKFETKDPLGNIRIHMQLAAIFVSLKHYEKAEAELSEAVKIANGTTYRNIPSMINRRIAIVLMCRQKYSQACILLNSCAGDIINYGSYLEKACFFVTLAQCLRLLKKDPRVWLKEARFLLRGGHWPAMEKLVIAEIVMLHDVNGLYPNADRAFQMREKFGKISAVYPGKCDWMLF